MKDHETVPGPSIGQVLELSAAVLKQLPRDLTAQEAQRWIGHQGRLGEVLRQALKIQDIFNDAGAPIRGIQVSILIQLGYPEAANMTKDAFAKLIPVPENKGGALLIIPANIIPVSKQMKLLGGTNYLLCSESLQDIVYTPKTPYWIYGVENGKKMLGKSRDVCVKDFAKQDRRGLTAVEGINLVAQDPNVLKDHCIDLLSSRYNAADSVPYFRLEDDRPMLYSRLSGDVIPPCSFASCLR